MKFEQYLMEKLSIRDENDNEIEKRNLKFTKRNIEKIDDADVKEIDTGIKHAILKDSRGRLIFIDEV